MRNDRKLPNKGINKGPIKGAQDLIEQIILDLVHGNPNLNPDSDAARIKNQINYETLIRHTFQLILEINAYLDQQRAELEREAAKRDEMNKQENTDKYLKEFFDSLKEQAAKLLAALIAEQDTLDTVLNNLFKKLIESLIKINEAHQTIYNIVNNYYQKAVDACTYESSIVATKDKFKLLDPNSTGEIHASSNELLQRYAARVAENIIKGKYTSAEEIDACRNQDMQEVRQEMWSDKCSKVVKPEYVEECVKNLEESNECILLMKDANDNLDKLEKKDKAELDKQIEKQMKAVKEERIVIEKVTMVIQERKNAVQEYEKSVAGEIKQIKASSISIDEFEQKQAALNIPPFHLENDEKNTIRSTADIHAGLKINTPTKIQNEPKKTEDATSLKTTNEKPDTETTALPIQIAEKDSAVTKDLDDLYSDNDEATPTPPSKATPRSH